MQTQDAINGEKAFLKIAYSESFSCIDLVV